MQEIHSNNRTRRECPHCGKQFLNHAHFRSHLNLHLHNNGRRRKVICELCGEQFARRHCLQEHISAKHTLEKAFACKLCKFESVYVGCLRTHVKFQHGTERRISCYFCPAMITQRQILYHFAKHTRELHLLCRVESCRRRFRNYEGRKNHEEIIRGNKITEN